MLLLVSQPIEFRIDVHIWNDIRSIFSFLRVASSVKEIDFVCTAFVYTQNTHNMLYALRPIKLQYGMAYSSLSGASSLPLPLWAGCQHSIVSFLVCCLPHRLYIKLQRVRYRLHYYLFNTQTSETAKVRTARFSSRCMYGMCVDWCVLRNTKYTVQTMATKYRFFTVLSSFARDTLFNNIIMNKNFNFLVFVFELHSSLFKTKHKW